MKTISTYLFRHSLLLIFFSLSLTSSSEEYKPMIRYDRVWEHISVYWNDKTVFYTRFECPEEINGMTYHRLATFRKARYDYDKEGKCYLFDIDDNFYRHEGYLREEDGKVYTLVSVDETETAFPRIDLYTSEYEDKDTYRLEEKLLYDFNCKEGESYLSLHLHHTWGEEISYTVKSIDTVEIDGKSHKRLKIYPEEYDDFDEPIIESIGICSYGCLTTFNILNRPTCPCLDYIFNRVIKTDGSVIYRAGNGATDIPLTGFLGVDNIGVQSKGNNAPFYDISGHRIAEPTPNQLYIQGSRKHIAK